MRTPLTLADLKPFCSEDRPGMTEPFTVAEYTYATNGHIAIRVGRIAEASLAVSGRRSLWASEADGFLSAKPSAFIAIPDLPSDIEKCGECNGTGNRTCANCGQSTQDACEQCDGDGQFPVETVIAINEIPFNSRYLRLIKSLPNAVIATRGAEEFAIFKFDGGMGALMPMQNVKPGDRI